MHDDISSVWERFCRFRRDEDRNRLFDRYRRLVRATRSHILPFTREAEDLEQEGAITLLRAIDRFDPGRNVKFEGYAIEQLRGTYRNIVRKQNRRRRLRHFEEEDPEFPLDELVADDAPSPLEQVLRDERNRLVREAMRRLTAQQQRVLYLRYWQELSQSECGRRLGMAQPTVREHEVRAIKKLRELLGAVVE